MASTREARAAGVVRSDQDDGGTIEPRRRAAGQAPLARERAGRGESGGQGYGRQLGPQADGAHHGAAGPRNLAVVVMRGRRSGDRRDLYTGIRGVTVIMMMRVSRMHRRIVRRIKMRN